MKKLRGLDAKFQLLTLALSFTVLLLATPTVANTATLFSTESLIETAVTDVALDPIPTRMEISSDSGAMLLISYYAEPWTASYSGPLVSICEGCSVSVDITDHNLPFGFTGLARIQSDNPISVEIVAGPGEALQAEFLGEPVYGTVPLTVAFTAGPSCSFCTFEWMFGDGHSSSDRNPVHTYVTTGFHDVELTVSLPVEGTDEYSLEKSNYVWVTEAVEADFDGTPLTGLAPLHVSFSAEITGTYNSLEWDFGDGATIITLSPTQTHTYERAGTYTVKLFVYRAGILQATATKSDFVEVEFQGVYLPMIVR